MAGAKNDAHSEPRWRPEWMAPIRDKSSNFRSYVVQGCADCQGLKASGRPLMSVSGVILASLEEATLPCESIRLALSNKARRRNPEEGMSCSRGEIGGPPFHAVIRGKPPVATYRQ